MKTMHFHLSVIICTYNPNLGYLERVLDALKNQTLPLKNWELLIVDNANEISLINVINVDWHPNLKIIREEKIGHINALIKGISECNSDLIISVDDDNILNKDFLEIALSIKNEYTFLGVWGGQIFPEFEEEPEDWTKPYWRSLAIREFKENRWSNMINQYETTPCGAGMCMRKSVADAYVNLVRNDPNRESFGRTGNNLLGFDDSDLAFTSCDLGYGIGLFANLKLIHILPPHRLSEEYLLKLVESLKYSRIILESFRGKMPNVMNRSLMEKLADYYFYFRMSKRERRFYKANKKGSSLAIKDLKAMGIIE